MTRLPPSPPRLSRLGSLLLGAALATAPAAQTYQGLMPFRSPQQNVEAPDDLFRDLQLMIGLAEKPGEFEVRFDDAGREASDNPVWLRTREVMKGKMFNMAAMFGIILRDSRHVNDRKLAAYGTFYVEDVGQVFELIAFLPGEPDRSIRQEAFRRAIAFLRVHWPKQKEPDPDVEPDPDYPPGAVHTLEVMPFIGLLNLDEVRDQAQGLWFLKELCSIRDDCHPILLFHSHERLRSLLVSKDRIVRREAREYLRWADPKHREPPAADASDPELLAWLEAVVYDVFPPIRRVNKGRTDLYASKDLDQLVKVGREALETKAIGGMHLDKLRNGQLYRGFKVMRLPAPLDQLRIPLNAVVTAINGTPVATGEDIIKTLELWLEHKPVLMVEYVAGGKTHAMEFWLQKS